MAPRIGEFLEREEITDRVKRKIVPENASGDTDSPDAVPLPPFWAETGAAPAEPYSNDPSRVARGRPERAGNKPPEEPLDRLHIPFRIAFHPDGPPGPFVAVGAASAA